MGKDIELRRRHVEELYFYRGVPIEVIAEIMGCHRATISSDCQIIKERLVEKAQMTSDGAVEAVEEVAALLSIAHGAIHDAEFMTYPTVGQSGTFQERAEAKARMLEVAAKCLYLAGRLKQNREE
jgi:hypothetical protein